jgi:large subunit ribosomal protein L3
MKFIIGRKIDMTQIWKGENVVPATRVQAGPCVIAQVKTEDKDGYASIQLGYGVRKQKNINKPQIGHLKGLGNARCLREFRIAEKPELKKGDIIDVGTFESGDKVKITGTSKGKGFQGVVKRHGFSGTKKTHGNKDQLRMPGSIGAKGPAHVFKGTKMGGRMGGDRVSVNGLEILDVDTENNILLIKGALPGARNGLILISGEGELKIKKAEDKEVKTKELEASEASPEPEKPAEVKIEETVEKAKKEVKETAKDEAPAIEEKKEEKKSETPEEVEKEVVEAKEKIDSKSEEKSN